MISIITASPITSLSEPNHHDRKWTGYLCKALFGSVSMLLGTLLPSSWLLPAEVARNNMPTMVGISTLLKGAIGACETTTLCWMSRERSIQHIVSSKRNQTTCEIYKAWDHCVSKSVYQEVGNTPSLAGCNTSLVVRSAAS